MTNDNYVQLQNRIVADEQDALTYQDKAAEALAAAESKSRDAILARWEFGRLLLQERVNKQLPNGRLDELSRLVGVSRRELQYRLRFAEKYATEDKVRTAVRTLGSWRQIRQNLPEEASQRPAQPKAKPLADNPVVRDAVKARLDEIADTGEPLAAEKLAAQLTDQGVPVGRKTLETVAAGIKAEKRAEKLAAESAPVDVTSLGLKGKELEKRLRRSIRKELEAEFEPRVQAEVRDRVQVAERQFLRKEAIYDAVIAGRKGVYTKAELRLILACLHPDSRLGMSDEKLADAFRLVKDSEVLLQSEEDLPVVEDRNWTLPDTLTRRTGKRSA